MHKPRPTTASTRVRIKICGVRTVADARAAVAAGADAIGLVFTARSRRRLDIAEAQAISAAVGPFVSRVGLFMDDDAAIIEETIAAVALDMLQFHGNESPAFCAGFDKPYIKAIAMGEAATNVADAATRYDSAAALLLDGNRPGEPGGQGETFDWGMATGDIDKPVIVAGGLDADNVGRAITALAPYAVDVSSGVESAPGEKSTDRMQAFVNAVLQAGKT